MITHLNKKNKPNMVDVNYKKITSLCVNNNKNKTIGILHIHNILEAKIQ